MGLDRRPLRALPGATFVKLLGTGSGRTFTMRDADPHHWAVLVCWSDPDGADRYEQARTHRAWSSLAHEQARFLMRPLASRGSWARRAPFGAPVPDRWDGPVAALTRARIRPTQWRTFWQAVPPVAHDAHAVGGMRVALGIGEAPIGLQGTFSVWDSAAALTEFTHRRGPHTEAVRRTAQTGWYAEELFARLALLDAGGSYVGRSVEVPVAGSADGAPEIGS
jgi:hypothetical protein